MPEFSSLLPMGNDSITRKWMEYQPDRKETIITLLGTGIIFGALSYYSSKAYLITGTVSFITYQGLVYEKENALELGEAGEVYEDREGEAGRVYEGIEGEAGVKKQSGSAPLPLRVLSFVVLSSFIGKSIRESWVKPTHLQSTSWASHLLTPPFYVTSFFMVAQSVRSECREIGYHIPNISEKHSTIALIASTVLSAAVTFSIPEAHLLSGMVSLCTTPGILMNILTEKSDGDRISSMTAIKVALCWSLGSYIGKVVRAFIGPTSYAPTRSWLAFFSLLPLGVLNITTVLMLQLLISGQASLKVAIDNEEESVESVSNVLKLLLQMFRGAVDELPYILKTMQDRTGVFPTAENWKKKIEEDWGYLMQGIAPGNNNPFGEQHPAAEQHYIQNFFERLVIKVAENNNQGLDEAVQSFTRAFNREFEKAQAFLDKEFEKETQEEYEPEELTKKACQQDPQKYIDALKERIQKFNEKREKIEKVQQEKGLRPASRNELTKNEAAYILLVDIEWDDAKKNGNYKALSVIIHPDKYKGEDGSELFQCLTAAKEALD